MDIKQISKTILRNLKTRVIGKSSYGHQDWADANPATYDIFHDHLSSHDDFMEYFKKKLDVKSVLEVGCGTGVYPIKTAELFKDIEYTGNDFSQQCIDYCKKNSTFNFICGDFIKMSTDKKYDMVFSHSVVDHVYDPVAFIANIVKSTKKYAYISNYLGYFPNLKKNAEYYKFLSQYSMDQNYNYLIVLNNFIENNMLSQLDFKKSLDHLLKENITKDTLFKPFTI